GARAGSRSLRGVLSGCATGFSPEGRMLPVRVLCAGVSVWLFAAVAAADSVGLDGLAAGPAVGADGGVESLAQSLLLSTPHTPAFAAAEAPAAVSAFVGDADGAGRVDFADVVHLAQHYGMTSGG